jgi:hypothetical protein
MAEATVVQKLNQGVCTDVLILIRACPDSYRDCYFSFKRKSKKKKQKVNKPEPLF